MSLTLGQLSFDHEWFRVRRRVVHRGRLVLRILPLFPGYIFIMARYMWAQIEQIIGVRGFVRFGGCIEEVPDCVIHELKARCGCDGTICEEALPFARGSPVWVRVGGEPQPGTFIEFSGPARALVNVSMFGRICAVQARLGEVRRRD